MKVGIAVLAFFFLAVVQSSFLVHFSLWGAVPNVVALGVLASAVSEQAKSSASVILALSGGFFLDIFSGQAIGVWAGVLLGIVFGIKLIKGKYVWLPSFQKR